MKILAGVARGFSSIFGRKANQLNRSKLVGLYLKRIRVAQACLGFISRFVH